MSWCREHRWSPNVSRSRCIPFRIQNGIYERNQRNSWYVLLYDNRHQICFDLLINFNFFDRQTASRFVTNAAVRLGFDLNPKVNIERNLGLERYLLITPSMQPIQRRNTIDTRSQIPQPVVVANVTNPRPATISRRSTTDTRRQLPQTPPRNLLKAKVVPRGRKRTKCVLFIGLTPKIWMVRAYFEICRADIFLHHFFIERLSIFLKNKTSKR